MWTPTVPAWMRAGDPAPAGRNPDPAGRNPDPRRPQPRHPPAATRPPPAATPAPASRNLDTRQPRLLTLAGQSQHPGARTRLGSRNRTAPARGPDSDPTGRQGPTRRRTFVHTSPLALYQARRLDEFVPGWAGQRPRFASDRHQTANSGQETVGAAGGPASRGSAARPRGRSRRQHQIRARARPGSPPTPTLPRPSAALRLPAPPPGRDAQHPPCPRPSPPPGRGAPRTPTSLGQDPLPPATRPRRGSLTVDRAPAGEPRLTTRYSSDRPAGSSPLPTRAGASSCAAPSPDSRAAASSDRPLPCPFSPPCPSPWCSERVW